MANLLYGRHVSISPSLLYSLDPGLETNCFELLPAQLAEVTSSAAWLARSGLRLSWGSLQRAKIAFNLTSLSLQPLGPGGSPGCFQFR